MTHYTMSGHCTMDLHLIPNRHISLTGTTEMDIMIKSYHIFYLMIMVNMIHTCLYEHTKNSFDLDAYIHIFNYKLMQF